MLDTARCPLSVSSFAVLAAASLFLGLALRKEPAGRVLALAAIVAATAFVIDIYCY